MAKANAKAAKTIKKATSKGNPLKGVKVAAYVPNATSKGKAAPIAPKATNLNPYRNGGGYWATVEALKTLGIGKMHDLAKVAAEVVKAMKAAKTFAAFDAKDGKLTTAQRIVMNVSVTARKDYGKPLIENGYEVRFDGKAKTAGLFKIGK